MEENNTFYSEKSGHGGLELNKNLLYFSSSNLQVKCENPHSAESYLLRFPCSVKQMQGPKPHNQLDADLAAGMGMPDNGLKLMSSDGPKLMAM